MEATLNFRALRGMAAFIVILLDLRHPHENKPELTSCGVRARPRSSECHTPDARVELFWTVWLPADSWANPANVSLAGPDQNHHSADPQACELNAKIVV